MFDPAIQENQSMRLVSIIISLVAVLFSLQTYAQAITVQGSIKDGKGRPVAGASISLKDSYDGATSDSSGHFHFKTTEKGSRSLIVSFIGYRTHEQEVNLRESSISLGITLKELVTELNAVILTAGTFEASDRKRASAVLDPIDIVTTASANGEITGALKTLPGAQQVGESEGLYVRGGTAAETRTFIDGTLVNNFFYSSVPNIAQFSRFSPFLFKGTVFSTGGYSALYGQALSSALILESIDLPERSSASLGLTVLSANAGYQHLAKNKNSSWGGNYSYTDLAPIFSVIRQKQDYSKSPAYHNADLNFRIKTSSSGILKYYGYFSNSRLAFTVPSIDSLGYYDRFAIRNNNFYHNLSWKESLGTRWKMNAGLSYADNHDEIAGGMQDEAGSDVLLMGLEDKSFELDSRGRYFNSKLVIERRLKGLSAFRAGAEYNYSNDRSEYTRYNGEQYPNHLRGHLIAAFAEGDIYMTNSLALKLGGRWEHSSLVGRSNIAPRASLAYKLGTGSQASLAWGIFYQNPENRWLPAAAPVGFMKATHYIAQYQRTARQQSFRAELFYKKYEDLLRTALVDNRQTAVSNAGSGDAKGIEFFWRDKRTFKGLDYWISYSYLDTKRDHLNFPFAITPNFAARHTGSLVLKRFVQDWKMNVNASYNYASGRPYYNLVYDGSGYNFSDRGTIPDYHNLSLAFNYLPFIGKKNPKSYAVWVLQVSNLFNFRQTYGYQYSLSGHRKEAIVPTSRMFVFLGVFISFGVDRSEEIINNAL